MTSLQKATLVFVIGASIVVALWALPRYERWHGQLLRMSTVWSILPQRDSGLLADRDDLTLAELKAHNSLTLAQLDALSDMERIQTVRQSYYNETTRLVLIAEVVILTTSGVAWFAFQPMKQRR